MSYAVRTELGEEAFAAIWKGGQALTREQVPIEAEPQMLTTRVSSLAKALVPYSHKLTPREKEVLRLLSQGLSSALIAEKLVIGLVTVNSHVRTIYSKPGVSSRRAATRYAIEHGLV